MLFRSNNSSEDFIPLKHFFDVILCDVPCSGEGMFRKDENAISEWSDANVENCVVRQKQIIDNINHALTPGGILIYSTCTYNVKENEQMLEYICETIGAEVLSVNTDPEWGIHKPLYGDNPAYRFMPHTTKGEGLFIAVMRKNDDEEAEDPDYIIRSINKQGNKKEKNNAPKVPDAVRKYLLKPDKFEFSVAGDTIKAIPKSYSEEFKALSKLLKIQSSGIEIATLKGKDIIPAHALALSTMLDKHAFEKANVDQDTAISYLRREAISLPEGTPKGYVLVCFEDSPIGWVKNIGNRSNNLYPQEWRIRSGYTPENISFEF